MVHVSNSWNDNLLIRERRKGEWSKNALSKSPIFYVSWNKSYFEVIINYIFHIRNGSHIKVRKWQLSAILRERNRKGEWIKNAWSTKPQERQLILSSLFTYNLAFSFWSPSHIAQYSKFGTNVLKIWKCIFYKFFWSTYF